MMLLSALLTPFSARIAERTGPRVPVIAGLVLIAAGSIALALVPASMPVWASALLLIPVGMAGPLVMSRPPPCCWNTCLPSRPALPVACSTPAARSAAPWLWPSSAH